jgi:TonB family protein
MPKRKSLRLPLVLLPLLLLCQSVAHAGPGSTEREQDGLAGPVRRVKTETAKITVKGGQPVEGARAVLETTTYDQKGNRVDNAYFLAAGGALTGKEVYKYDERGNIVEMTLHGADGSLIAKEVYTYEFDAVGNWVKMTTAVAVIEGGKVTFEPSEVTYRTISYYMDDAVMAKLSQPGAAQPNAAAAAQPAVPTAKAGAQTNPQAGAQTNSANAQTTAQAGTQAKPSPPATDAAKQTAANKTARNTAAPLVVASLDKGALADAGLGMPAASGSGLAAASPAGPAVKSEGDAPAAPVRTGPLKPVSGGILNGRALSLPPPAYPEAAKRAHASGLVVVEVVIDGNGKVISAKAVRGPVLLMQTAEMAARLARFTPTLLSGQPVRVVGLINYNFSLQQ